MALKYDHTGQRFERLLVIKHSGNGTWTVQCDCGTIKTVAGAELRKGKARSCGCLRKEYLKNIPTKPLEERFWGKVDTSGDCWEWTGAKVNGYGSIRINRETVEAAHRVSWRIHHGEIPQHNSYHGMCVCHSCDNPGCVNPDHLFLGTAKDNAVDMASKGRNHTAAGEGHPMSKLTEDDVRQIRHSLDRGITTVSIAEQYGVDHTTISCIATGKTWRSITHGTI